MAENQEGPSLIENLATVTDAIQTMFPNGKIICVYELNETEYKAVQSNFRAVDNQHTRFSIDMSGLEHVFILENTGIVEKVEKVEKVEEKVPEKKTIKQKLFSWFKSSGSSVK
jgi:ABC-type uncharacterized transport system YnjBCD substrate-binding protein